MQDVNNLALLTEDLLGIHPCQVLFCVLELVLYLTQAKFLLSGGASILADRGQLCSHEPLANEIISEGHKEKATGGKLEGAWESSLAQAGLGGIPSAQDM